MYHLGEHSSLWNNIEFYYQKQDTIQAPFAITDIISRLITMLNKWAISLITASNNHIAHALLFASLILA